MDTANQKAKLVFAYVLKYKCYRNSASKYMLLRPTIKIQILNVKSECHGSDLFVLDKLRLPQGFPFLKWWIIGPFKSNHKQRGTHV